MILIKYSNWNGTDTEARGDKFSMETLLYNIWNDKLPCTGCLQILGKHNIVKLINATATENVCHVQRNGNESELESLRRRPASKSFETLCSTVFEASMTYF